MFWNYWPCTYLFVLPVRMLFNFVCLPVWLVQYPLEFVWNFIPSVIEFIGFVIAGMIIVVSIPLGLLVGCIGVIAGGASSEVDLTK